MRTRIQGPPLDIETKKCFCRRGNYDQGEKGTSYDGEEPIKFLEPIFEDMTKNLMKGFKFLAIQGWIKYIYFKKTKGENV